MNIINFRANLSVSFILFWVIAHSEFASSVRYWSQMIVQRYSFLLVISLYAINNI